MLKPELLVRDLKVALRSLARTKGLAITVMLTLALGIGANAAIFSVVRGVLLRPLVNRDENRLIYIRQSAPGIGDRKRYASPFPKSRILRPASKTLTAFGDFSTIGFSHGRPRRAARSPRRRRRRFLFRGHGLAPGARPVAERATTTAQMPPAPSVLTYRFWTAVMQSDPSVIGKTVRLDTRARPPSSACWNRPCLTRQKPKSSPTSSPARTISPQPWSPAASIA